MGKQPLSWDVAAVFLYTEPHGLVRSDGKRSEGLTLADPLYKEANRYPGMLRL